MNSVLEILRNTVLYVLNTLAHNSPALILGVLIAAAIQVYVDPEKMKGWLMRRSSVSIPATVAFGAFTPFCACGTMAVVLSMLATALPWGPVMAFLTSSPLMSPEEFVMMSGILGPAFAIALAVSSVLIGLGSGYATHVIEKKTHFLDNQLRFGSTKAEGSGCGCAAGAGNAMPVNACCAKEESRETEAYGCGCGEEGTACGCGAIALGQPSGGASSFFRKYKLDQVIRAVYDISFKRILPLFALFAGIGYLINQFIPAAWISALFGSHNVFAIPIAAAVGLPLYVNGDSSIPLLQSLMQSGVSGGAMLAFMITGPGTSAGVLAGIATIMKKKAIALYIAYLLLGAVAMGYAYQLLLTFTGM